MEKCSLHGIETELAEFTNKAEIKALIKHLEKNIPTRYMGI